MPDISRRDHYLDAFKFACAVAVVLLHTNWLAEVGKIPDQITTNALFRLSVPCFFIISGFFLSTSMQNGRGGRSVRKMVGIYVVWSILYLPFWLPKSLSATDLVFSNLIMGFHHLWYLVGGATGAAIVLLLRESRRVYLCAVICAVIGLALQYLEIFGKIDVGNYIYRNGLFFGFPMMAIGFWISRREGLHVPLRVAFFASVAVIAERLFILYLRPDFSNVDIMVMLYIAAPLLSGWALSTKSWAPAAWARTLIATSTPLYLIHPAIQITLRHFLGITGLGLAFSTLLVSIAISIVYQTMASNIKLGKRAATAS